MFNLFSGKDKKTQKEYNPLEDLGVSGTEIFNGLISQEYLADLQGERAIDTWNKMRSSDTMVSAGIQAFKLPLLSANYFIEGENDEYVEFINDCLFNNPNQNWEQFIEEAYNFPIFGFYYFEKIFKMREDGKIVWDKFAPRIPSAHLRWMIPGDYTVEQQVYGTQTSKDGEVVDVENTNPKIPFNKLLYFVNQKEGDNYEGRSILRPVRQAWLYKQKLLKMLAVYYERYGVGIPVIKMKSPNKPDIDLYKEMFANMRANKQSYFILTNPDDTLSLFGAESSKDLSKGMESYINYLDKQISKAFLAMFLTTGDTGVGSQAKQETDVEFFMLTIKSIAKNFVNVMNGAIKELMIYNYPTIAQEDIPRLNVTELEKIDIEQFSNMVEKLTNIGYISPANKQTQDYVRESLDLPDLSDEDFEEQNKENEEMNKDVEEDQEKEVIEKKKEKPNANFFLAERTLKEKLFQKSINEEEKFLQDMYKNKFLPAIEATEATLKKFLDKKYSSLDTEMVGGVKKIKRNGNQGTKREMISGVNKIMKSFKDRVENPRFVESLHRKSMNHAIALIKDVDRRVQLAEIMVNEGDLNSFMGGYKSNMSGVVFNEGRRVKEKITDNLTQGVSLTLAKQQVADILFNRNVYKLSAITHPRALYRKTIQTQATSQGMIHYKALLPSSAVLGALGLSAAVLYTIKTQQDWDKMNGVGNVNVVGGMGLHHNSLIYFMPIAMSELEEQEEISRRQRAELEEEMEQELDNI